jgi:aromatic-amino-acid transaminase
MKSFFSDIQQAAPDAILGITEAFRADTSPGKVNLGVGVYQDGEGKSPILESVRQAMKIWTAQEDTKTYLPIDGVPAFVQANQELIFGKDAAVLKEKRVATIQSVGGSGALKLAIEFIKRFLGQDTIYISDPSWENHRVIFEAAGMRVETYPYYDPKTCGLRESDMLTALRGLKPQTPVLLHACCHNPTGVDLDEKVWREVVEICAERQLIPLIDFAYQGFADGLSQDAKAIQMFIDKGLTFFVANSFAKSLSMYRERVGAISVVTGSEKEAKAVTSQIKRIVRMIYSSPPSYGAQLTAIVMTHPELRPLWEREVTEMRERIHEMRHLLATKLKEAIPDRDFSFILKQRGMFSYSGLSADVMKDLRQKYHVYGLDSGRICVAAINHNNVEYVVQSVASLVKGA